MRLNVNKVSSLNFSLIRTSSTKRFWFIDLIQLLYALTMTKLFQMRNYQRKTVQSCAAAATNRLGSSLPILVIDVFHGTTASASV